MRYEKKSSLRESEKEIETRLAQGPSKLGALQGCLLVKVLRMGSDHTSPSNNQNLICKMDKASNMRTSVSVASGSTMPWPAPWQHPHFVNKLPIMLKASSVAGLLPFVLGRELNLHSLNCVQPCGSALLTNPKEPSTVLHCGPHGVQVQGVQLHPTNLRTRPPAARFSCTEQMHL